MSNFPLVITLAAVLRDHRAFEQPGGRGARKIIVTDVYPEKERVAVDPVWEAGEGLVPVLVGHRTEMAYFDASTPQDRHFHNDATEVYTVLRGVMKIWAFDQVYTLYVGDSIVVPPGVVHEVLRETEFLAQVVASNSGGPQDKHVVSNA